MTMKLQRPSAPHGFAAFERYFLNKRRGSRGIYSKEQMIALLREGVMPIPESGCEVWLGGMDGKGYGRIKWGSRYYGVHRLRYELEVSPVGDGLEIDHKCKVKSCCNPDHLEPVPHIVNSRRVFGVCSADVDRNVCLYGHPLTPDNLARWSKDRPRCLRCDREKAIFRKALKSGRVCDVRERVRSS